VEFKALSLEDPLSFSPLRTHPANVTGQGLNGMWILAAIGEMGYQHGGDTGIPAVLEDPVEVSRLVADLAKGLEIQSLLDSIWFVARQSRLDGLLVLGLERA
jgi:hypothetical protein